MPILAVDSPGFSYRCASLAPPWQRLKGGDVNYRPTHRELVQYIHEMANHPNIQVKLNTEYSSVKGDKFKSVDTTEGILTCHSVVFAVAVDVYGSEHLSLPKWPVNPDGVTNGARMLHATTLRENKALFDSARRKYVLGASKATLQAMQMIDPEEERIVWAHQGHPIFKLSETAKCTKEFLSRSPAQRSVVSQSFHKALRCATVALPQKEAQTTRNLV